MKILAIGDIVGSKACEFLRSKLNLLKNQMDIDLVIANGENSADGNGITPSSANYLFDSGVDIITLGNHTFRRPEMYDYLDDNNKAIIRPYNFPKGAPGKGFYIHDMGRIQVAVINLMGQAFLDPLDCPFSALDEIFENNSLPKIVIVDFHAEATGEKRAFGFYCDGKISGLFGTHTHVPTADAQVLPKGTAYITDVGMTGAVNSVLGVKPELIIKKLRTKLPVRFELANDVQKMDCFLMDIDENTGLCVKAERFSVK